MKNKLSLLDKPNLPYENKQEILNQIINTLKDNVIIEENKDFTNELFETALRLDLKKKNL